MNAPRPGAGIVWRGEWLGALNAVAAMLPFVLTYGFIVYGALGDAAAQIGLTASVVAVVIGGAAMVLFSRVRLPTASPSASSSLILGGAVLPLAHDAALAPQAPGGVALLLALTGAVVVAAGLLQMLFGALRAGSLVRFVPQPVLAGFMNGIAILIVVSQVPPLLGLPAGAWARDGLRSLAAWQGPAPLIALATALLMLAARWRWPRLPAPLLAMAVAGVAVALWQGQAAPGSAAAALPRIGPLSMTLPRPDGLAPLADAAAWPAVLRHGPALALTALLLALIGTLESVLNLAAIDQQLGERSDANRSLIALGASNVVSGLFGGLPLVYLRLRAMQTLAAGGRTWRAVLLSCALLLACFTLGLPLVQPLATAVVAGVVVMLAGSLSDTWTRRLAHRWWHGDRSADLRWSLVVVALVCAMTLAWGFVAGVGAGVLAAMLLFMRTMQRELVRAQYSAAAFPSRRVYADDDERRLAQLRERIRIVELEGALFFGSAERLLRETDPQPAGTTDLIVDLRRVSTVDASGAFALAQLARQLGEAGVRLRLAGVAPDGRHGRALAAHGVALAAAEGAEGLVAHPDLDRALEAAEQRALAAARPDARTQRIALEDCQLADGLDAAQLALLRGCLHERRLAAGEKLFSEGDPGHALYLLLDGSVSVVDATRGQRFATFSPGMCFGETAVLDGGGRTADAVADVASTVLELPEQAFVALQTSDPQLAIRLYRNLARHLSQRLRAAAAGWRRAAE